MNKKEHLNRLWSDNSNWKLGSLYFCKEDPRILVYKRFKWTGWSPNLASKGGVALLMFFISLVLIPFASLCRNQVSQGEVILFLIFIIAVLVGLSMFIMKIQDKVLFSKREGDSP